MNQALRKLSGLLVLPVLLAALLILPVGVNAEGHECYAELPVHVDLNGENDEQFHVTIEVAPEADPSTPLPAEAEDGLWIPGDSDGKFTGFYYTEPGNYEYIVRQECGDTAYMTYDDTVYHVVIQVTNTQDGGLSYQVFAWTDEDSEDKAQELAFLNTYAPPTPTPAPTDEHPDIAEGIANGTWGSTPTPKPTTSTLPQTSDSLPLTALIVVLVVAAAAIVVLVVLRKRGAKKDEQK